MKETIIILGAGVMQGPAITIAKELGFYAVALDGSSSAPCVSMADRFEQIDLKNKEEIETFARSIQSGTKRLGIMTAGTDFSASVAWTAEKLGLPGIPYEAALNASDKSRMRECFKRANLPSPEFITITSADINSSALNDKIPFPFPLVIKPVDNMGSRGCRRVDSIGDFEEAAKTAIGFSRSGRAIAESYMEGPEFSVDAIVYRGEIRICGLADRHIFFPPYFIEMGHTMPTVIDKEKQNAMLMTFTAGVRVLGVAEKDSIGAAKGDIKLTPQGPMIGEIAARLSGGYMSGWTYPYSSGTLPIKIAIKAAMGREQDPSDFNPAKNWTCAERAFISIPGTVKQILMKDGENVINKTELIFNAIQKSDKNINDLFSRIKEGDKVSFPENNVTKCGNIIASAPIREDAVTSAEKAARSILIRLDPNDNETIKFLNESQNFPPDAFLLTEDLQKALNLLPESKIPEPARLNDFNSVPKSVTKIIPFAEFQSSNLQDYMGRTVKDVLEAVNLLTGACASFEPLQTIFEPAENADNIILGRSFWKALVRGSYQGAVYYIDKLGAK
ncbi:MAG: ATP-grasp domain-containing protein [Treponema sp.]|nr:ATP-grasp domain-containing protein [Treponema sp.]